MHIMMFLHTRTYPKVITGNLINFTYNNTNGDFSLNYNYGISEVYLSFQWKYDNINFVLTPNDSLHFI